SIVWMHSKRLFRSSLLHALAVLVPLLSLNIPLVHAIGLVNQQTKTGCVSTSCSLTALTVTSGNELIVIIDTQFISSPAPTVTDSLGNSYSYPVPSFSSNGNIGEVWAIAIVGTSGSDVFTAHYSSGPFVEVDALQYVGFNGIGNQIGNAAVPGSGSGSDALTISLSSNSLVLEAGSILNSISNTCGSISLSDINRFN